MKITSITIRDYLSFDGSGQTLGDMGPLTVLIGKNNSGKSNVLRAIRLLRDRAGLLTAPKDRPFRPLEQHRPPNDEQPSIALDITFDPLQLISILSEEPFGFVGNHMEDVVAQLSTGIHFELNGNWNAQEAQEKSLTYGSARRSLRVPPLSISDTMDKFVNSWEKSAKTLGERLVEFFTRHVVDLEAFRRLDDPRTDKTVVRDVLRQWRAPASHQYHQQQDFDRIQDIFRGLSGLKNITLEPQFWRTGVESNAQWALFANRGTLRRWPATSSSPGV